MSTPTEPTPEAPPVVEPVEPDYGTPTVATGEGGETKWEDGSATPPAPEPTEPPTA
ncbi:hypothetical protein CPT_Sycamore_041 [Streptomyces phage Sycamore]|uniref:Uncharacterized protein n=1 Tax=Streptomyces phage Sycamore TaxID=2767589 RepID=A0A873WPI1_9CAUD|nr:hypothetical protein CPT_Sycamore_041 [Streptomyces phage Sycamore]